MCHISPQGLTFRSKASLQAFLLKNGPEGLNINLFNFTASIDEEVTTSSKVRQKGRKKKHRNEQQDNAPGVSVSEPPLNKVTGTWGATVATVNDSVDPDQSAPEKIQQVPSTLSIVDDVAQQKSPQRAGLLREKILRLVPHQQNACKEKPAGSASVPILNIEPLAEGENNSEDERGRRERQGDSRGGDESDLERDVDANCVGREVLSPGISGGSCTQVSDSQNSKYDLHHDSFLRQIFKLLFVFFFKSTLRLCSSYFKLVIYQFILFLGGVWGI